MVTQKAMIIMVVMETTVVAVEAMEMAVTLAQGMSIRKVKISAQKINETIKPINCLVAEF